MVKNMVYLFLLVSLLLLVCPDNAHAYIDPGTGSYFLQILLAAILGVSFAVKSFWRNIKSYVVNLLSRRGNTEDDGE